MPAQDPPPLPGWPDGSSSYYYAEHIIIATAAVGDERDGVGTMNLNTLPDLGAARVGSLGDGGFHRFLANRAGDHSRRRSARSTCSWTATR